ncbi:MAG: PPC domain-containing protein [Myxococcales bacterium]|nr:PPC domain-containing protein [Myxococcales bacterium]
MNTQDLLLAFCCTLAGAFLIQGCDDAVSPGEPREVPGELRDSRTIGNVEDAAVDMAMIALDPDDGIPLLDAEAPGDGEVAERPDAAVDTDGAPNPPPGDCTGTERRLCTESCGVSTCTNGTFGPCQPAAERCNGHDDNCDGQADETYNGLGIGCTVQMNGCSAPGTRACTPDGSGTYCAAEPVAPMPEVCDGADNDCDGTNDEDFPGQQCCTENFQCPVGAQCVNGQCEGGPGPGPNGCLDDFDCDLFEVCVAGDCVPFCLSDLDCGPGESCIDAACIPEPPCVRDADCAGALVCLDGECVRPPGANSCDMPVAMPDFGVYRGSNAAAFDDLGAGCGGGAEGPEQVFTFTLDAPAFVTLATLGTEFDTVLSVSTACGGGMEVACDDDGGEALDSRVEFAAEAGVEYFVVVHGYSADEIGDIVLTFSGEAGCAVDADCAEDQACAAGRCVATSCGNAVDMPDFGLYQGDTTDGLDDVDASCAPAPGREQVYTFQLAEAALVVLDTSGSAFDTVLSLRAACRDAATELACDDNGARAGTASRLVFEAEAGVRYFVLVEGRDAAARGAVALEFSRGVACAADEDCAPGEACADGLCTPTACAGAIDLPAFGQYQGNNAAGQDEIDSSCVANAGREQLYTFQLDEAADVTLDTTGSAFDTVLSVRTACDDPGSELACDDDGAGAGFASRVEFFAEAGVRYYVVVEGYNANAQGAFTLDFRGSGLIAPVDCNECEIACVNELCVPAMPAACNGATVGNSPGQYVGNTAGLPNRLSPSCAGSNAPEDVLLVMFRRDTDVTASTAGSDFDTVLYVLEGCDPNNEVVCNDDSVGLTSEVSFRARAGVPYYIVVDGYNAAQGGFTLTLQ